MKFFKKLSSKKEDKKQINPKYTVGSHLIGGDAPPCSDKERRLAQVENSVKMNTKKLGKVFSWFSQEQLKSPDILKPDKDDEL